MVISASFKMARHLGHFVHHSAKKDHCFGPDCWLDDDGTFINYSDVAPAPCKDFYNIHVDPKEIIFRWWKIIPPTRADSNAPPLEIRNSYDDFLCDDRVHSEIQRLAGNNTLVYLKGIADGKLDYLPRIPEKILKKIILMLDLEDIARLSQVSAKFREMCNSNELWEKIYRMHSETPVSEDICQLASEEGWKKLFFTNKLQLQMQIRRQRRHHGHGGQQQRMEMD